MQESHSPKSEDPDDRTKREPGERMLILMSAALDLATVVAEHSHDGTLTGTTLVSVLAAGTKVVIALTR